MRQVEQIKQRGVPVTASWPAALGPLAVLALLVAGLWNLGAPPPWWDEGWTLSVARNWVERGHYGRLLLGQLAPPGMEAAFPVTAPVALGFRLFGVAIWSGRLAGVLFMVGALALIYQLALRLYNRAVAIATLAVLLLMSMHPQLHPLVMGRQVLAEMPMLFYLLAGYACLLAALRRSTWLVLPALLFWGVAIVAKVQVLPFWAGSLAVALLVALFRRRWRAAWLLAIGLPGALLVSWLLPWAQQFLLRDHTLPATTVSGLYEVMALVLVGANRLFALEMTLLAGVPTLLGLGYAAWRSIRQLRHAPPDADLEIVRLALLALAGGWFAWYVLLSVGVPRYLFPATFVGSMFVAALLYDLTDRFDLLVTLSRSGAALRSLRLDRARAGALLSIAIVALTLPITAMTLYRYYVAYADTSALQVAQFLNTQTPPDSLVETYESEVHFLLNRRYHYPPDQTHVDLNRRSLLGQTVSIAYDPLATDPDYLVVGRFSQENRLYEPVLAAGAFRLIRSYGGYRIYERAR